MRNSGCHSGTAEHGRGVCDTSPQMAKYRVRGGCIGRARVAADSECSVDRNLQGGLYVAMPRGGAELLLNLDATGRSS
jgi:hypothetical protein